MAARHLIKQTVQPKSASGVPGSKLCRPAIGEFYRIAPSSMLSNGFCYADPICFIDEKTKMPSTQG